MKYCTQCGTQTEKDERFCLVCGAEIPDVKERIRKEDGFNRWWLLPTLRYPLFWLAVSLFIFIWRIKIAKP